ncbi:head decoration protein [Paraglaciecola psychrophila]|uniref:Head decoration protein n=1 Tax=Paraglaciecola psychrophila 170 TaxID=1129794 RepID=K6ZLI2_9ALTE|nr:head decoration protein [Paraglaciecola psychrophila]AGH44533.1 hypothetical protein C427_2424 [Paraglaciecola psychrophila 170]GAC36791.1 hypothetical protein GPSY_1154 [Paraglaciecola psychrophila 170]
MTTEALTYVDITSGSDEIATTSVTILSGEDLAAAVPIGQVTLSGKFVECDPDATNGSQTPKYITAQAIDATGGDVKAQVYKSGTFDTAQIAFHANFTAAEKLLAFVGTPISLQTQAAAL